MDNISIETLSPDFVQKYIKLTEFRFTNNEKEILTLPRGLLTDKKYLHTVVISAVGLKKLPIHFFKGSENILQIDLSNNQLEHVER